MDRLLAKGEVPEEEMRALEMDVTGKIMLASWRGTRFEVVQVLREVSLETLALLKNQSRVFTPVSLQVVDNVLKDHSVSDQILYNRAKVPLYLHFCL